MNEPTRITNALLLGVFLILCISYIDMRERLSLTNNRVTAYGKASVASLESAASTLADLNVRVDREVEDIKRKLSPLTGDDNGRGIIKAEAFTPPYTEGMSLRGAGGWSNQAVWEDVCQLLLLPNAP